MEDELAIVEQCQFQGIAVGAFDRDRGIGNADLKVFTLLFPGEIPDQLDRFFRG